MEHIKYILKCAEPEFVLCHRKPFSNNWQCERGFKNVSDINKRSMDIRKDNIYIMTTFFPTYKFIPNWIINRLIRRSLKPCVAIMDK